MRGEAPQGGEFTLDDFLEQLQQVRRRWGRMRQLLGMIPGIGRQESRTLKVDERQLERVEAIIRSMTPTSGATRSSSTAAAGAASPPAVGTNVQEVNQLLNQFKQMQKMMKQIGEGQDAPAPGMTGISRR